MGAAYQALPGLLNGLLMIFPRGLLAEGRDYRLTDASDRVVKEILA